MYGEYFTYIGFHVLLAADGAEAFTLAKDRRPDAIVMDLAMPHMDGFEAIRRLRSEPATRDIPLVVLTGNGLFGHAEALKAGCDAYLLKPCLPDDLVGVVASLLDAPAGHTRSG